MLPTHAWRSRRLIRTGRSYNPDLYDQEEFADIDTFGNMHDGKNEQIRAVQTTYWRPPIPAARGGKYRYKRTGNQEKKSKESARLENIVANIESLVRDLDENIENSKKSDKNQVMKMMRIG